MKRMIIHIDEERCTGCGQCIPDCPEGALQMIEGKARLVSDLFCDGLGACIRTCPEGAISVIEREAGAYDERAVMEKIIPQGPAVITAHLEHLLGHGERGLYAEAVAFLNEKQIPVPLHRGRNQKPDHPPPGHPSFAGCPGAAERSIPRRPRAETAPESGSTRSALAQWPVQLALLNPRATFFEDADLLIAAVCVPFAYADFHRGYLGGKIVIIFCPKLDPCLDEYIEKLAKIFSLHAIRSITILHMEVPCCNGVTYVVNQALDRAKKDVPVKEVTITIDGRVL